MIKISHDYQKDTCTDHVCVIYDNHYVCFSVGADCDMKTFCSALEEAINKL